MVGVVGGKRTRGRWAITNLERGEMDDAVDVWVLGKDTVERSLVGDINLVEGRSLAADQFNSIECDDGGVVEAVDDDDIVVVLEEGQRGERANVASATASHKLTHEPLSLSPMPSVRGSGALGGN